MSDKLPVEEDLKLENLTLNVNKAEIHARMQILEDECKHFKSKFIKLEKEHDTQTGEFETHQDQAMQKRHKFKIKKGDYELKIKSLEKQLYDTKE